MSVPVSERYPCETTSPSQARAFCTRVLNELLADRPGSAALVGDAEMVVSELVTNAVNAAGTFTELVMSARDGVVRIEVCDDGSGVPRSGNPGLEANSGRGLMIVAALSDDWGVVTEPGGKRVWAELSVHHVGAC